MYCQYCGTQNPEGAKFCTNCKTPLSVSTIPSVPFVQPVKKKRKTTKVLLIVLFSLIAFVCIGAAIGNKSSEKDNMPIERSTQSVSSGSSFKAERTKKKDGVIGDYVVLLKNAEVVKSTFDGDIILVVTYSFTNNSDKSASFDLSISDKAFQNGVETGAVYSRYGIEDAYDFEASSREIQPGITLDVQEAYELNDTTSDVLIEISKLFSFKDDKITYTVELDKLD